MKQPIITRDIERKAIYTDIVYDPEWTYLEVDISRDKYIDFYLSHSVIIDWGDGTIDKNTSHRYGDNINQRQIIIRIKGDIKRIDRDRSPFKNAYVTKVFQIGNYVTSCCGMFLGCSELT